MSTIRDVAERARVAPITVSRVINHSGHVSEEMQSRVKKAIAELGYVPNRLARSLRLKQTHTLALVLTDITNPFWTTLTRGVEDMAQSAGFNLILCNTDESTPKQEQYLDVLLQKQIDGILLAPVCGADAGLVQWIESHDTPIIILDRRVPSTRVDIVRGDSEGGAYQLIHYLLSLGHRQIAVLGGPRDVSTSEDRVTGYCKALAEVGLDVRADWICYGRFNQESGYEMTNQVISTQPRPTALFACNNFIAVGALRALEEASLNVPDDISIVAFDDLASGLMIEPFLTVADQPAYEMGRRATELLLARLSGSASDGYQDIVLPVKIMIRRSSRQPKYI